MEEGDDVQTLTVGELQCTVNNIIVYLRRIVNNSPADAKWACDWTVDSSEEDGRLIMRAKAGPDTDKYVAAICAEYDTGTLLVTSCVGLMQSPLLAPAEAVREVPLQSFTELLDFMIVHLCPSLCIPRAVYYIVHCMKMCLPDELVDAQIAIDESDGEFVLQNPKARRTCRLRMKLNADGVPVLRIMGRKHRKLPAVVGAAPQEGVDFVQHAFCRSESTQYVQHPAVAQALRVLLEEIGLAQMDAALRTQAETLLAQTAKKRAAVAPSRSMAGG